jgi:hypothetical protein
MEHVADVDTALEQVLTRGVDVADHKLESLGGARRGRRDSLPEEIERAE